LTAAAIGLGIFVVLAIVISLTGTESGDVDSNRTSSSSQQSTAPQVKIPASQAAFIEAVDSYIARWEDAENELKGSAIRAERSRAIRQALSGLAVQGWVGGLRDMGTDGEGKAYVAINLEGPAAKVATWNNAISDVMDDTLILPSPPLFASLAELSKGDRVRFDGTFVRRSDSQDYIAECSLTRQGSMTTPDFLMRFSRIKRYE